MYIVLVDDKRESLVQLQSIIQRINPMDHVLGFQESIKALEYIRQNPVDEVFIEINMQKMTGLEMTRQIKSISKKIKVNLMAHTEEYAIEAWNVHADYFLLKPITVEAILSMRA